MRQFLILAMVMGLATPVAAQDVSPSAPDPGSTVPTDEGVAALAIEDVINQQLGAFNARDVELAWGFASPMIQGLFGNPRNFGVMVNRAYPMVWDNSAARFIATREADGHTYQQVMVQDTNGQLHLLEYAMIQTAAGWKIDGVSLLPSPDVGV